jgi:hypothetical protein
LIEAVKGNYDRVAFASGDQTVGHYKDSVTSAVDSVSIVRNENGTYSVDAVKGMNSVLAEDNATSSRLQELFGKAGAEQLVEAADATPGQTAKIESRNLSVGGDGLRRYYDTIIPKNLAKLLAKFGGPQVGVTELLETPDGVPQMAFDVTPALRERLSGGLPLFQSQPEQPAPRGAYDPARKRMMLDSRSDVSTFLHEMAHHFLVINSTIAADPNSSPQAKENMDRILRWFGIAGNTAQERLANWNAMSIDQQRKYHEQLALNFEIYMFTGKAPSIEMERTFRDFSRMLRAIYNDIKTTLNDIYRKQFGEDLPILQSEVRMVFDSWFATPEQIERAQAVRSMVPLYQTQEESGMSDQEWAEYQEADQASTQSAISEMAKRSLSVMQWMGNAKSRMLSKMQAEHRALRSRVREEAEEEVKSKPIYRAMAFLRTGVSTNPDGTPIKVDGAHRLDMDALESMYPATMADRPDIRRLGTGGRGMMGRQGIHPDVAAERFGYASGDQLVRALLDAKPLQEEIDSVTDERMIATYGDSVTDKGREEAVEQALHNEARARFVAVEAKLVSKATEPVRLMLQAARIAARQILGKRKIREIRPSDYAASESRSARDAEAAHAKKRTPQQIAQAVYTRTYGELLSAVAAGAMTETDAIAQAKQAQASALAEAQAREAEYVARYGNVDAEQVLIKAKRMQLLNNQLTAEAVDAIEYIRKSVRYMRNILSDENRKRMGAAAADQIEKILERYELRAMSLRAIDERKALSAWVDEQRALGFDPDIPESILNEIGRMSYRDMTLEDFQDLVDTVKQIEQMGKNERRVMLAAQRASFEETRNEIVASIDREGKARGRDIKPEEARTKLGRASQSAGRFLAAHLKVGIIAQILDGGKEGGPVWSYLIRTANDCGNRETRMRAEATEAVGEILTPLMTGEPTGGKGRWFPTVNMHLNREARIVFALNWGNDGNKQRLLGGSNWTEDQVMPVLQSLTEEEWTMVQRIWDFFEQYRPMIAEKERRIYGKEPKWIEPVAFEITSADGKTVQMRGGYFPIAYDPRASISAQNIDEIEKAKQDLMGAHVSATTRRSFVKSRKKEVYNKPLRYSLSTLYSSVNDVIHDLTWHEWLIDANRLVRDREFDAAVRQRLGPEYARQISLWVKDIAAGERGIEHDSEIALALLRQNISAMGLGYNLVSGAVQIVGLTQSIVKVGARYIGRGIAEFAKNPKRMMKEISEKSMFMADRGRTQFRELNEIKNMVSQESLAVRRFKLGVFLIIVKMQRMVDVPTWAGAYEKAIEAGEDEATSVALADQAVIDSQGSGMTKDLANIERGGPWLKLYTTFYTFMNTVHNIGALKVMTERNKAKLVSDMLLIYIVPPIMTMAIKSALRPDEKEEELDYKKLARALAAESLEYMLGTFVIGREFAGAGRIVTGSEGARDYTGPAGLRLIAETYRFLKQAYQMEFDKAFLKATVNMLGASLGIPAAQINRTIDAIDAISSGKVEGIEIPQALLFGTDK